MTENQRQTLERVLYATAFVFFALRFLFPGDTVYILDEAFMQLRLDEHFAAGTIPFSNSRGSSIPLPYGPGALWFFMVARLFTWQPVGIVLWHLCFQMVGYFLFVITIRRAYGREAGAWCALLSATSPILFFFSRHPWDSTLYVWMAAAILFLLQKLKDGGREFPIHFALGLVGGYAVNTHLMFGPVLLALGFTLLLWNLRKHSLRRARSWQLLVTFGGAALLVLLPYLIEAYRISRVEQPFDHARNTNNHWGDGRNLWWIFLRTTIFSSLFKARAMLDDEAVRTQFFAFTGPVFAFFYKVDIFGWIPKLAAWGAAFATLARLARLRFDDEPLRLFAALSFLFILVVFQFLNIPMASHYFLPVWWFVFLGVALAIQNLRYLWRRLFLFFLAANILVNTSYLLFAITYLHENKGARNMEASVAVSEQLRNLRFLCAWGHEHGKAEVKAYKGPETSLGEPAFEYLPAHMPECAGVKITLVTDKALADFILHHPLDSRTSAALVADPRP
jgi:4-amino-4-deoxy-L-arabinose transferase-like glycosyltransferase